MRSRAPAGRIARMRPASACHGARGGLVALQPAASRLAASPSATIGRMDTHNI
jgi:hypothetical protein